MIEATVIQFLSNHMEAPVYAEVPEERPERYILVEKVGGGEKHFLSHSMVAIQSIVAATPSTSRVDAALLNETLKKAMINDKGGILSCHDVTGVRLNSDSNFTDPESGEYRYQALYEIDHY